MIACCPDSETLNVSKSDYEELEELSQRVEDELLFKPEDLPMLEDAYTFYSTLKTMWMMGRWIDEEKEETLCDDFNVGPGDIYRHVESTEWLLTAAGRIAELNHHKQMTFVIEDLRRRVRYGIKQELLELASLHGVGRIRARQLFNHGYRNIRDLHLANADQIGSIKSIGKALARSIITQTHGHPLKTRGLKQSQENQKEVMEWKD